MQIEKQMVKTIKFNERSQIRVMQQSPGGEVDIFHIGQDVNMLSSVDT